MKKSRVRLGLLPLLIALAGCAPAYQAPDLGGLYNARLQAPDPDRNPIIVIPGIMGSRLVSEPDGRVVWGAFGGGAAHPDTPEGARLMALPMAREKALAELRDRVRPDGALDRLEFNVLGVPVSLVTYAQILAALGVGGYRDETLGENGSLQYGDRHFTCFQFDYDWRRDVAENARALHAFILEKEAEVRAEIRRRYGVERERIRFDIAAHSFGGLVARYYLRYGGAEPPETDEAPSPTWAGAAHVERVALIGTPNAGAAETILNMVEGLRPATLFPHYPAAILGTMPSIYQLLPRGRHGALLDRSGRPVPDLYDPQVWRKNRWGLADPTQADVLKRLLPDVADPAERRSIALDHQAKALRRARRIARALDVPGAPPTHVRLLLVAGDAKPTWRALRIASSGDLAVADRGPGDGVVLRASALMDERAPEARSRRRLASPVAWDHFLFLFSDHLGLTRDPAFTDNILFFLLESPAPG